MGCLHHNMLVVVTLMTSDLSVKNHWTLDMLQWLTDQPTHELNPSNMFMHFLIEQANTHTDTDTHTTSTI